jgi:FkbM family methyltransferase
MSEAIPKPPLPFTTVVPTAYGQMLINRNDINQTAALFRLGVAADHAKIMLLGQALQVLGPGSTFIDVGANFGTYSLALAPVVGPAGKVHAFEPQRIIFNMLAGSVALNALTNVWCHNMAVGDRQDRIEMPQFDYGKELNFGSIEFGPEQRETLSQERRHDPERVEYVSLTTIDSFAFPRADLMKIDTEGMEMAVLAGAADTITRCRPVLYVEWITVDRAALQSRIEGFGYETHLNGGNLLCVPLEMRERLRVHSGPPAAG